MEKEKNGPDVREGLSINSQHPYPWPSPILPSPLRPSHQSPSSEENEVLDTPRCNLSAQLSNLSPSHVSSWRRSLTPSEDASSENIPDWRCAHASHGCHDIVSNVLSAFRGINGIGRCCWDGMGGASCSLIGGGLWVRGCGTFGEWWGVVR